MRALILLLASSWCTGYPALHEPVYVLVSQPVSPAQQLSPALPTQVLQDYAPSSSFASPEEEASQGHLPSLLDQDPLLKGGVLVAEPVLEALSLEEDHPPAVEEGTPVVDEVFPMLETLTVIHENPVVNHGRLVAVTLTFLEEGKQALKGASLVESSIITRHEPSRPVSEKNPRRKSLSLNEVETQTSTLEKASVDYAPPADDRVSEVVDAFVYPSPVGRSAPHVLKPVPVVEPVAAVADPVDRAEHAVGPVAAGEPVVDPAPVPEAAAAVAAAPLAAEEEVVDPAPVGEAAHSVVDSLPAVEDAAPVAAVVAEPLPLPVVRAVAPSSSSSSVDSVAPAEPLFVAEPPMPSAATPFVGGQFHAQDEAGRYSFGHWGGLNTRVENRDFMGRTSGSFAYVDPDGSVQVRKYVAEDGVGFRVAASDLPRDAGEAGLAATEDLVGRPVVSRH